MAKQLEVYRDWLGIQEPARPLNYYQLLRLKQFEDDPAKIREHYRKLNGHVRKFGAGDFAQQSQELLNELAKAMLCLTDEQRKDEYDAALGRPIDPNQHKRRSLEEILLRRNVIDQEKLTKARNYAMAVGVEIRDALVQQRIAPADVVMPAYAESEGLPFLDLNDVIIDPDVIAHVPAMMARQHSLAPVMIDNNHLLLASPQLIDPHIEEELRLRSGMNVRTVLCTPAAIHEVVNRFYTKEAAAAEASRGATPAKAAAKPKGKGQATATAAAPADDAPLTADQYQERQTERRNLAVIAFNFTFMVVMGGLYNLTGLSIVLDVLAAFTLAGIAAAIAWIVKK